MSKVIVNQYGLCGCFHRDGMGHSLIIAGNGVGVLKFWDSITNRIGNLKPTRNRVFKAFC